MFSKADNYMNEGCFQSVFFRVVNTHILQIYTCKNFWYCIIFCEIMRLSFWLKSYFMLHFLALHWQSRFCVNEYIAKFIRKSFVVFFSGRFDVHFQVIQPILIFPYSILLIKYPQVRNLKQENYLKECNLWLTLKWIRRNTAFHWCLHSDALFGHCYTYLHGHNLAD